MPLAPIELVVIGFPQTPSGGRIAAEVQRLVDNDVITLVDGLLISKDDIGSVDYFEIEQVDADEAIRALGDLVSEPDGLLADEDVEEVAAQLAPGSSALMLVFENSWVKPLRDAIFDAGGVLMAQLRVPGAVVEDVMAAVGATQG